MISSGPGLFVRQWNMRVADLEPWIHVSTRRKSQPNLTQPIHSPKLDLPYSNRSILRYSRPSKDSYNPRMGLPFCSESDS